MAVFGDLVGLATESGAQVLGTEAGVRMTWDMGRTFLHLWGEEGRYCFGTSERAEPRIATMISPYEEIMLKWAVLQVGDRARVALQMPPIVIPDAAEKVDPIWAFEQMSLLTGRLVMQGEFVPMELRTIFPAHRDLNVFSQVIRLGADELLASYRDPEGRPALGEYVASRNS